MASAYEGGKSKDESRVDGLLGLTGFSKTTVVIEYTDGDCPTLVRLLSKTRLLDEDFIRTTYLHQ